MDGHRVPSTAGTIIRAFRADDRQGWLALRQQLWPDSDEADARAWLSRKDAVVLIAESASGEMIGFAEVGLRPYADGCSTSPVAFLEGWYVLAVHRGMRAGAALVQAAAVWARQRGIHELASDSLLGDAAAFAAHIRVGFKEVERSIKYRMPLE